MEAMTPDRSRDVWTTLGRRDVFAIEYRVDSMDQEWAYLTLVVSGVCHGDRTICDRRGTLVGVFKRGLSQIESRPGSVLWDRSAEEVVREAYFGRFGEHEWPTDPYEGVLLVDANSAGMFEDQGTLVAAVASCSSVQVSAGTKKRDAPWPPSRETVDGPYSRAQLHVEEYCSLLREAICAMWPIES